MQREWYSEQGIDMSTEAGLPMRRSHDIESLRYSEGRSEQREMGSSLGTGVGQG